MEAVYKSFAAQAPTVVDDQHVRVLVLILVLILIIVALVLAALDGHL